MKISKCLLDTAEGLARKASDDPSVARILAKSTGMTRGDIEARARRFLEATPDDSPLRNVPSVWLLTEALREGIKTSAGYLPPAVYSRDEREVDVRLQVSEHGWQIHTGDACYDQDHRGYWGASSYTAETRPLYRTAREIAADLIDQATEHASQVEDDPTGGIFPWINTIGGK